MKSISGKVQEKIGQVKKVLGEVVSCGVSLRPGYGCKIHTNRTPKGIRSKRVQKTTVTTIKGERTNENNL